ncbi:MAG: hypothetical protein AAGK14_14205 [Verrucomicrobiota bacterium]
MASLVRDAPPGARVGYAMGAALVASGLFHLGVWAIDGGDWEGPLAWRKPILFGLSTGVTCWSMAWVAQLRQRRWADALAGIFGVCALVEVAIITLQTWRGRASHFNTATPFDAGAYYVMEALILAITLIILVFTVAVFVRAPTAVSPPMRAAVRAGLAFLAFACLFGIFMVVYGTQRVEAGADPGVYGEAGVLKFVHGMPIHAIQLLPIAAWLFARTGWSPLRQRAAVHVMVWGTSLTLLFAGLQTGLGRARFDLTALSASVGLLGLAFTVVPLLMGFLALFLSSSSVAATLRLARRADLC